MLIISTLIISRQVDYLQSKNLGYDKENLVCIPLEGNLATNYKLFKENAQRIPGLKVVSRMGQFPTDIQTASAEVEWEGKDPQSRPMFTQVPPIVPFSTMATLAPSSADLMAAAKAADPPPIVIRS